jgi:hypothetical protein
MWIVVFQRAVLITFRHVASSIRLERTSSGSGDSFKARAEGDDSDGNDSDIDLAGLRRARLQHPGTISMFGSFPEIPGAADDEDDPQDAGAKLRKLFDLPLEEKILTGTLDIPLSVDGRISRMACEKCHDTRIYAPYRTIHMLLCSTAENRRSVEILSQANGRIPSLKQATSIKSLVPHLDGIGSGSC